MNARTRAELLKTQPEDRVAGLQSQSYGEGKRVPGNKSAQPLKRGTQETDNPVIHHLDNLQGQLSEQLDSLNTVVASMQRISAIMDRMAKKNCTLNNGAALVSSSQKQS
ncbi:MAG: hypothetical protein R3204_05925 [Oceanospirillum sp.]|nr:hypothetical protein [Oceanospirillum sp.]